MTKADKSTKKYSKGALKLILTAEKLFGEQGIEGVSLRQIVAAAGLVNSYSIQHHFGSKEGLVQAVYDYRIPALEEGCRIRLEAGLGDNGKISVQELLAARLLPFLDAFNPRVQKSCSLFLLRLFDRNNAEHPHFHSTVPQPSLEEIQKRLMAHFSNLPAEVFNSRFRLATDLFLGAIVEKKRLAATGNDPYSSDALYWNEILQAIEAIFCTTYTGGKTP
jgi:AcrR family transcriptional regulator